jgi:3-hydroxyethyl bacteriochlorophyllide a dehydrogenase
MQALCVLFEGERRVAMQRLGLTAPGDDDVVVDIAWSGISTGTERLLWDGRMPDFPGLGYPLVPGYEAVGRVVAVGSRTDRTVGETVFVPGARCFGDVRGLFGASASRVVVPGARATPIAADLGESGILIALAATAVHAIAGGQPPDLIVGHGVLGRLLARVSLALGAAPPTVWETRPARRGGAAGYSVSDPAEDPRRDYVSIYDASGDENGLDILISRLSRGGELVLAGFYAGPIRFAFPPAFMREARLRVAAEWQTDDLAHVLALLADRRLSFDGLITHRTSADAAVDAYETAFNEPECLKMILDWRGSA